MSGLAGCRRAWQLNHRLFRVGQVEHGHMANSLNQNGARALADLGDHGTALFPVIGDQPNLDQFVVIETPLDFHHDRVGQAIGTRLNDGAAVVGETLEVLPLRFIEGFRGLAHGIQITPVADMKHYSEAGGRLWQTHRDQRSRGGLHGA